MDTFFQDLRFSLRTLLKRPGFTAVAVLTLTLGIGATTAIFSVVNGVLLRPLPFREPERTLVLWENNLKDGIERDDVSPANFLDWRERNGSFEHIAFVNPHSLDYLDGPEPETWLTAMVSEGFFDILGANAIIGRTFTADEYRSSGITAVVLTYGLWQRNFGSDPNIVGQKLRLDDQSVTIVGVLSPEFKLNLFEQEKVAYAPQFPDESMSRQRRATYLKVVARLREGVTVEQARGEMDTIASGLASEYPQTNNGVGVTTVPLADQMTGHVRPALLILLGAVGFVLLIACANVANLLLARASERTREFAIRAALGAGRRRIIRQLMTESLMLSLLGGVGGLLLAVWSIDLIVALSPGNIPRIEDAGIDATTMLFALLMTALSALLFGLAPSLQLSTPNLNEHLKEARSASPSRHRLRSALVVAEIALAMVLLVGAGLLVRSFVSVLRTDPGFASDRVLGLQTFIWDRYTTPQQRATYVEQVLERLKSVPGVTAAGVTTALPFFESSLSSSLPFTIEGEARPQAGQEPTAFYTIANNDYFAALGVPLVSGRLFTQFDRAGAPLVILINETMAKRLFPDQDPVGKKILVRGSQRGQGAPLPSEIVGVVGDLRHEGLDQEPRPEYFRPYEQSLTGSIIFAVRTSAEPAMLIPTLKERLWEVDSTQPIYQVATLDNLVTDSLRARRFSLLLLGSLAALALMLALVGIYGVMSLATRQRTHEIGVRMALGARGGDVMRLVMAHGLKLAIAGVGLGLAGAVAMTRLMRTLLYEVSATDPLTFIQVAVILTIAAVVACYIPARRATKVDPMIALRYE
ncbi:MAG TPA: ABC transporter permease [Blastocatellia bacterium]|nr:ABC transporter permease [Blastocatellia bacterium]